MGKYFYDKPETVRVNGGGRFSDEWFDISPVVSYDTVMEMGQHQSNAIESVKSLAFRQIVAHSITNSDGSPVVLTRETFGNLPYELIFPVLTYVNDEDFLAQLSAQAKAVK